MFARTDSLSLNVWLTRASCVICMLQTLRLYDAPSGRCRVSIPQPAPLLDCTFQSDTLAYTAGLDGAVKL